MMGEWKWARWTVCGLMLSVSSGWAYEYDTDDSTQGAGPDAAWRVEARWDQVDEISTKDIHHYTTDPRYISPMVSYVPEDANVPSPRDVLGYTVGTEGILTRPDDEIKYFEALAAASPHVSLQIMGPTEEGRNMHLVVVTDAGNQAQLDQMRAYTAALADPRKTTAKEAADIIQKAKPIMHITAGLHSPETGPPEMVMELAYRLAVSKHPDIEKIRKNVILLITPVTDVDGRAKVVDWYYRYLKEYDSREYMPSMSPPYWGKYTYHDNNRDGLQMSQLLTQNYMKAFLDWHPVYSIDLHESVPLMYVSGGTGPYNPTIDPLTVTEWQWAASYEMTELQKHNMPGVWTWGFYTGWNPSYLLWITNNHNSMGRFYETFGNLSAKTMERDLTTRKFVGKAVTEKAWYRADPPDEKVMWSLRNNTNYMQSGVLASLKLTSNNGAMLLDNFYRKGINGINAGKKEGGAYAWVIPTDQPGKSRLAYLINQLRKHAIEVHRATEDFETEEGQFKTGDFVVRLDQPYGRHATNLLNDQLFPKDAEHRPYDDVSWTFGRHYKVNTTKIEDASIQSLSGLTMVTEPVSFPGTVGGSDPVAYAVKHDGSNTLLSARFQLRKYKVSAAKESFEADGETFPAGSWIIPHKRGLKGLLSQIASDHMISFDALSSIPEVATQELDLPRIALYHNWVSTQNDGWVRFSLEDAGIPYDYIADYTVRTANLRGKYDVIIMAHQGGASSKAMLIGRDSKFGPQSYVPSEEFPSHGFVDNARDITGGLGFQGLQNLETFLSKGGTLLMLGSSGRLATDFGLVRNVNTSRGRVDTPGSSIQTKILRTDHPIGYGYDEVTHVFRTNGPIYSVPKRFDHWVVMQYGTKPIRDDEEDEEKETTEETPDDESTENSDGEKSDEKSKKPAGKFLLSGYVDNQASLEKQAAILDIPRNDGGRVVLYSFNPMHRHLNHGDHNFVFNALLYWNDYPEPEPKDHEGLAKD